MFNLQCAINGLSFGAISVGITYELFKRGISPNLFPISNNLDLSVFDKVPEDYKQYIQSCVGKSLRSFNREQKGLSVWHVNGSHTTISKESYLLTFHECDTLTPVEINILNSYEKIFVTSTHSVKTFKSCGVERPVIYCPMGFDNVHYSKINKKFYEDGVTMGLFGKFESRKCTKKVIQAWLKKFGGNRNFRLHCHVTNPFFKPEDMNNIYADIFQGKPPPFNVILYGFQQTNSLFNQAINACDIVLDMSGAETISLPSLTAVALGKHAVLHKCSGIEDWATKENSVLIEPSGITPIYDGVFFHPNTDYNQGNILTWNEDEFLAGCDEAIKRYVNNPVNETGFKLQKSYSYEVGVNIMLKEMGL
jgi:hypothetical protein